MIWIGIDPGKDTGIVVRDGQTLVWHTVVQGEAETLGILTSATLQRVRDAVIEAADNARAHALATSNWAGSGIAVEGLTKPTGFKDGKRAAINPLSIAAPAVIIGLLRTHWPSLVMVPPSGNGSRHLSTYPDALITAAERRYGINRAAPQSSTTRHARSAWDCAGAATAVRRIELARAGGAR